MLWSVAARFHFDGTGWTLRRLEFWYRGHVFAHEEETAEAARLRAEALKGAARGRS